MVTQSPFVRILGRTGLPYVAGTMNFVVLTAALSSMNTNIYLCSRMLFSLSRGRYAPAILGRLSKSGAPAVASLLSGAAILLVAGISLLTPRAYNYLFGVALFSGIFVWILILVSHLSFRRHYRGQALPVRTRFFPILQLTALGLLIGVLITMGVAPGDFRMSWTVGAPWLALISVAYLVRKARQPDR